VNIGVLGRGEVAQARRSVGKPRIWGSIESARYLEPMCMAWVVYGVQTKAWHHAFKMLR
jgi:hypothetical protein